VLPGLEGIHSFSSEEVIRGGIGAACGSRVWIAVENAHQPVRLMKRQRLEENLVHDAEDQGVCPDA
jgi:hypothetical protein